MWRLGRVQGSEDRIWDGGVGGWGGGARGGWNSEFMVISSWRPSVGLVYKHVFQNLLEFVYAVEDGFHGSISLASYEETSCLDQCQVVHE